MELSLGRGYPCPQMGQIPPKPKRLSIQRLRGSNRIVQDSRTIARRGQVAVCRIRAMLSRQDQPTWFVIDQQKKTTPAVVAGVVLFFSCAEVRPTVLMCTGLRTLHSKLTCHSRSSAVRNRSSARNRSWLRSHNRSSSGSTRTCHERDRKGRSSSSDGCSKNCSSSIRNHSSAHNRSSFRSHSFVRNRSSSRSHSSARNRKKLRSSSSSGSTRTCHERDRKDRSSSICVGSSCCSKNSRSHSSVRNHSSSHIHSFVHNHSSFRSHSHSCCRRTDRRRHSRFRPSRAPGRRQASQRQNIGSSGGTPKTRGGKNRRVVFGRRRGKGSEVKGAMPVPPTSDH
jgi:hypothetical protein